MVTTKVVACECCGYVVPGRAYKVHGLRVCLDCKNLDY